MTLDPYRETAGKQWGNRCVMAYNQEGILLCEGGGYDVILVETVGECFLFHNNKVPGVQPRWIQGDSKVGTELASLEITYLIIDREGLEN